MKKLIVALLIAFIAVGGCASNSPGKMKSPRKAHYKTKEGRKKQKFFNDKYRN
jgi:hypothetical protein